MAYPNHYQQHGHGHQHHPSHPSSSVLPYPHTYAHPYVYTLHPPSSHHHSYPYSSYSSTPYSTPPTTAPPSPKYIQRAYPHLSSRLTTATSTTTSTTTSPNNSNNMHHHMSFPEQIQSASSFRPPSSQSHHSAGPGTGTVTPAGASPYAHPHTQQHGVLQQQQHHHHSTSGPTLQVAHPTASAAADMLRHRSASPWMPPQQQQQQQSHPMYGSNNAGHHHSSSNNTSSSNISGALTLFNASSSSYHSSNQQQQQQQQHPLAQQHNHYSFPPSSSASHYNNGHDPYHSPEPAHATLQAYGFPHHNPYQSSSSSNVRNNLLPNHLQSYKYPSVKPESNVRSKIGGSANHCNNPNSSTPSSRLSPPQQRSISGGSANTTASATKSEKAQGQGQAGNDENSNDKGGSSTGPTGSANNYGIVDELNTTLYDLRDGVDGPGGKPPYPYLTLIRIALLSSPSKRLTLQELYDTLEARWPGHFIGEQKGWKNTVRHNLSLNKCFKKEARHILDPGKGAYWYCDPNEEHSTSRVRHRRKGEEGEIDGEGEIVHSSSSAAGKKRGKGGSNAKGGASRKRKAESPEPDADEYDAYGNSSSSFLGGNSSSTHAGHVRSVKLRVGDLKLPFGAAAGGPQVKRQRAISAPSPITPSFFNNLTNALQDENGQLIMSNLGMAPFGLVPTAGNNNTIIHQNTTSHYTFPQLINNPNHSLEVPKYQFPTTTYTRALTQPTHQLPAMPSLIADKAPESGSTESSFGIETPRTIYSGNNAVARPGTAKGVNNGADGDVQSRMNPFGQRAKDEQTSSSEDLARPTSNGGGNGNAEGTTPGPAQSYVFPPPAPQNGNNDPGQMNRVFVNPPGGSTCNIMNHSSPNSNNPFTAPHNPSSAIDDPRNRPAPLNINSKDGRGAFSPPSATSPTRLLNQEYGDLFSTAPFGMDFGAPKATSRKGSTAK